MSYDRFLPSIKEPDLVAVAAHWNTARGNRLVPGWSDIDPIVLGRNLPIVWTWRWDFSRETFIGRLAGEEIIAVLGTDIRGRPIRECFPANAVDVVFERYKTVLDGPSFMHGAGKVYRRIGGNGFGERIVMPLAANGIRADGIIGATVYRFDVTSTILDGVALDHHNELVEFFPLRP